MHRPFRLLPLHFSYAKMKRQKPKGLARLGWDFISLPKPSPKQIYRAAEPYDRRSVYFFYYREPALKGVIRASRNRRVTVEGAWLYARDLRS